MIPSQFKDVPEFSRLYIENENNKELIEQYKNLFETTTEENQRLRKENSSKDNTIRELKIVKKQLKHNVDSFIAYWEHSVWFKIYRFLNNPYK